MGRPLASIIVPVFNEAPTIRRVLDAVSRLKMSKEILAVDDGSTDGSGELLRNAATPNLTVLGHPRNSGKGCAVRTALARARGRFAVIQDADLETDPGDIARIVRVLVRHPAAAVLGTRFRGRTGSRRRGLTGIANRVITGTANALYGSRLSDIACTYKAAATGLLRSLRLKSGRFEIEAEITAKLLKRGVEIIEVPVRYRPRTYRQGKKIHPLDGVRILLTLIRLRFAGGFPVPAPRREATLR